MVGKVSLALLLLVHLVRSTVVSAPGGCCGKFSPKQAEQLQNILRLEAGFLQREMSKMCPNKTTAKWIKVTDSPVCFGAAGDSFGVFAIPSEGFITALKLEHRSDRVNCNNKATRWGCSDDPKKMGVFVTTESNLPVYPCHEHFAHGAQAGDGYVLPHFNPDSPVVVFSDFQHPLFVQSRQRLRLWFGKDLANQNEDGNSGQTCADVFLWFA